MRTAIKHHVPDRHLYFLTSGHSDAQPGATECSYVKNCEWRSGTWCCMYAYGNCRRQRVKLGLSDLYRIVTSLVVLVGSRLPASVYCMVGLWVCLYILPSRENVSVFSAIRRSVNQVHSPTVWLKWSAEWIQLTFGTIELKQDQYTTFTGWQINYAAACSA